MVKLSAVSYITCVVGSAKPLPELKKRVLSQAQQLRPNNQLGAQGEQQAVFFLKQRGFQILDTNVRVGRWELDIVALDRRYSEVVFIEVKTRSSVTFGHPSGAVGFKKRQAMLRAAVTYLRTKRLDADFRFDVITVSPDGTEHFENVTW